MSSIRIGISGWTYAPWRGVFYPQDVTQKRELEYASSVFNSIEINGTFYSTQRPSTFRGWAAETPDDFVFAVKGHQFITHRKRLVDCERSLANVFAQGVLTLGRKLGPILWQLPPNLQFDAAKVESFLKLLPHDAEAASKLAANHEPRMNGKADFAVNENFPIRHAMEVRHETFRDAAFIKLLREYNVALVVADTAGRYPQMEDVTADFVYCRLHGDEALYASGYSESALDEWARKIKAWSGGSEVADANRIAPPVKKSNGRDVFVFFDNDVKVHAPFDAANLAFKLGLRETALKPPFDLEKINEQVRKLPPVLGAKSAKAKSMKLSQTRIVKRKSTPLAKKAVKKAAKKAKQRKKSK
jgi:uncharacterized protein YecE (DUF72 family)